MKIIDILKCKKTLSFEVFPPKRDSDDAEPLLRTVDELKELSPDFISVTYGAGGSNSKSSAGIAAYIKNQAGIEALAHLTGGPSSPDDVRALAARLRENNIENILALRGDRPLDYAEDYCKHFQHATDLMAFLRPYGFGLAGACYPEGHSECLTLHDDLLNMKKKQDNGAEFFITQIFYDNSYYYRLVNEARRVGVTAPIIPGIMPLVKASNINRIKAMCGSTIPLEFRNMIETYRDKPAVLEEIGINYAVYQMIDLIAKGAPGVHLYIMNRADVAREIKARMRSVFDEYFGN